MSKSLELSPTLSLQNPEAITAALNVMLADIFALYLKTKNFHWHMSGPLFRDYHLLTTGTLHRSSSEHVPIHTWLDLPILSSRPET